MPGEQCPDCSHAWSLHDVIGCDYSEMQGDIEVFCPCVERKPEDALE